MKQLLLLSAFICTVIGYAQQKSSSTLAQFQVQSPEIKTTTARPLSAALVGRPELTPYAINISELSTKAVDSLQPATAELKPYGERRHNRKR